jgi:uncharacterized protein
VADEMDGPPGTAPGLPAASAAGEVASPPIATPSDGEDDRSHRGPPSERLDPRARTVWRINAALWAVLLLGALGASAWLLERWGVPRPFLVLAWTVAAALAALGVTVAPGVLYGHWRYELRADEIDLQHGLSTITRTLIPMPRIQHVDTQRGPIQRSLGLASVVLYTAAGASTIPGLASETADGLRDRIAALAGVRDDL